MKLPSLLLAAPLLVCLIFLSGCDEDERLQTPELASDIESKLKEHFGEDAIDFHIAPPDQRTVRRIDLSKKRSTCYNFLDEPCTSFASLLDPWYQHMCPMFEYLGGLGSPVGTYWGYMYPSDTYEVFTDDLVDLEDFTEVTVQARYLGIKDFVENVLGEDLAFIIGDVISFGCVTGTTNTAQIKYHFYTY